MRQFGKPLRLSPFPLTAAKAGAQAGVVGPGCGLWVPTFVGMSGSNGEAAP